MRDLPPEHVLLGFFGVEPEVLDEGVPGIYNRLTYSLDRKADHVTCAIEPAEGQIEVALWRHGEEAVRVSLGELRTLDVIAEEGVSCLVAAQQANAVQLRLWLDPHVRVFVGAT
jgi:hypothetical protein